MKIEKATNALIVTFYQASNYGAFLQAFALQTFLENNGVEAKIYAWNSQNGLLGGLVRKTYKMLKSLKGASEPVSDIAQAYYKSVGMSVKKEQQDRLHLSSEYNGFDITLLGSDEIWNLRNMGSDHNRFFFCRNPWSYKTISYAPSVGKSNIREFRLFSYSGKGIKKLDAVSIRDEQSEFIGKQLGVKKYTRVLDPTFLIDFNPYLSSVSANFPYILVYTYGMSEGEIQEIRNYAMKNNLKLYMTGAYFECSDLKTAPAPFEWLALIKNAEVVITSTFHGTVFAIEFEKNFAVYHKTPKVMSVLAELGLENQLVSGQNSLEDILERKIDYHKAGMTIKKKIEDSKEFIINNLMIEKDN